MGLKYTLYIRNIDHCIQIVKLFPKQLSNYIFLHKLGFLCIYCQSVDNKYLTKQAGTLTQSQNSKDNSDSCIDSYELPCDSFTYFFHVSQITMKICPKKTTFQAVAFRFMPISIPKSSEVKANKTIYLQRYYYYFDDTVA